MDAYPTPRKLDRGFLLANSLYCDVQGKEWCGLAMTTVKVREFNGKAVVLGLVFIALPPWLAWGLVGTKLLHIRHMMVQGTDAVAVVDDTVRMHTFRSSGGRNGSPRKVELTRLRFDGFEASVDKGKVNSKTVPVIYDNTIVSPSFPEQRSIILGKKSDGFISVLHQNHGMFVWVPITVWTVINVFFVSIGVLLLVFGLGLKAGYKSRSE